MRESAPFDDLAASYDATFSESPLGTVLRRAVWRVLDEVLLPGMRVLELNCGTGVDAVHLARRGLTVDATDGSPEMVRRARQRAREVGLEDRVRVNRLDLEAVGAWTTGRWDGAFSNFGGLNCVEDLPALAGALAVRLPAGAPFVACLMGRRVPWEWGWFLRRGSVASAFRRFRRDGVGWRGIQVRYPPIGRVRRAFAPFFSRARLVPVGVTLPPTYARSVVDHRPRLLRCLAAVDRRLERWSWPAHLADHYVLVFRRTARVEAPGVTGSRPRVRAEG